MPEVETEIGFAQLGLGNVLKNYQLFVPPYQREYAWTTKEVRTLLQDLAKALADGERRYFLGAIVTIPRPNGVLEVVDGQQRLATTAILLSSIRDYLSQRDPMIAESINNEFLTGIDRGTRARVPKMKLNLDDNEFFRSRLTHATPALEPSKPSHRLLESAFGETSAQITKLVSGLDEKDHGDLLNSWIEFIESKALVILLRVPSDANAYRMFETLNDRGLRTSQSHLVKSYLLGRAGERIAEVQQKWAFMRGALETMEEDDLTITFLRHALIILRGFVREAQVYEAVQAHAKAAQPVVTFTAQLEALAHVYVAIHNSEHEKWNTYSDGTRRAIEVLNLLDIRPLRPLMLAIGYKLAEREAEKSFKFCVCLGVRLMIAGSTRSGSIEEGLAEAAHRIFNGKVEYAASLAAELRALTPTDERFQLAFETAAVSNRKLARYYLRSLEMTAKGESEPWHIPNDDRSVINLEHVLPEKPMGNWPKFSPEQVKLYYRRIGNMVLLQASENSGLNSADFETKKRVYFSSPYVLTEQVSRSDDWTPEDILLRQKTQAELALRAWPV